MVVSASERNKMSAQALATVMGPPLMLHSSSPSGTDVDHAQPIAVLKYLLQIWPQPQTATTISGNVTSNTSQAAVVVVVVLLLVVVCHYLLLLEFTTLHAINSFATNLIGDETTIPTRQTICRCRLSTTHCVLNVVI